MTSSPAVGFAAFAAAGIQPRPVTRVKRIRSGNDVLRLDAEAGTFFLKTPTKDLEPWPDRVMGAAAKVANEAAAERCLRHHGLPGPEVVAAELSCDNPVGRPYLLTRCVPGRPLTDVVPPGNPQEWAGPLRAVGEFLQAVHQLEFEAEGYLEASVASPPRPSHRADVAQAHALLDLDMARPYLDPYTLGDLDERFHAMAAELEAECHPPHFVIGGFHPNHPFLAEADARWRVVECVDLEVASAGSTFDDLATFATGMVARFDPAVAWWEPFFEGYGHAPSLERFRLEFLANCSYLFGATPAIAATYGALLAATSWDTLFKALQP